jgi:2-dehydro-3-deoxygluconokinase
MTVVALGEAMLRLKSPGHERLLQSAALEATIGGAEANVVSALAQDGVPSAFISAMPDGPLGDAALAELRRFGVDVSRVVRGTGRLGIYYLEAGAGHRPSRVIYDRERSAMATVDPAAFDWPALLAGEKWLHVSGITPAVSESAAQVTLDAVRAARAAGLIVSVDFNHRAALWKWGKRPEQVMPAIMEHAHIGIAGREDIQKMLGIPLGGDAMLREPDLDAFAALAESVLERFPAMTMQAITLRESISASHNHWSAILRTHEQTHRSRRWEIADMVDRIGAGDAFSAGLIYALITYGMDQLDRALEFATAASCLKHTIAGDVNRARAWEVEALVAGDGTGRVQR